MSELSRLRRRRIIKRVALGVCASLALFVLVGLTQAWVPMGTAPAGARLVRVEASPQWGESTFINPEAMWIDYGEMVSEMAAGNDYGDPSEPLPVEVVSGARFDTPPATGLRATWLGHSTVLLELDGHRVLTDPVWGPRTSPLSWMGPARWYAPPLPLAELPELDAVLISHDHYDHLDYPTIVALADRVPLFVVPLGVGAHLEYWGVAPERIVELDWWERTQVGGIEIVSTPARHASGRHLFDRDRTLWAGYALIGSEHRVYFSGDTGLFRAMGEIGERLGPFDLTMIEVGAYSQAWPDWHIGPEQAVYAHQQVQGAVLLPIHWGLFNLAPHSWTEPIERSVIAAEAAGVTLATPQPGHSIEPQALIGAPIEAWWPRVPGRSEAECPIVSTKVSFGTPGGTGVSGPREAARTGPLAP